MFILFSALKKSQTNTIIYATDNSEKSEGYLTAKKNLPEWIYFIFLSMYTFVFVKLQLYLKIFILFILYCSTMT